MAEDKFADEVLSDEELSNVAGGTFGEYLDLAYILPSLSNESSLMAAASQMTPDQVTDWLKTNLNINATINQDPEETVNVYTRNGQNLTHAEVIRECKAFLGK